MGYRDVIVEQHGETGRIVFNRPSKLNAFTYNLLAESLCAFERLSEAGVRVVVLTGAGRAFSAGDDLAGMGGTDPLQDIRSHHHRLVKRIREAPFPVVAALNGYTLGAGFDLALACDFRIASSDAELGDVRVTRAMNSMSGAAYWLPRLVGIGRATEILLLGERVTAQAALAMGLVHRVVAPSELERATEEFCGRLLELPTLALAANKACLNYGLTHSFGDALDHEARLLVQGFATEDWHEGIAAFLEKRKPRFRGR